MRKPLDRISDNNNVVSLGHFDKECGTLLMQFLERSRTLSPCICLKKPSGILSVLHYDNNNVVSLEHFDKEIGRLYA
ncbi:hypothetical protein V6N11_079178 [Hibiscus sabdariffa]|uniref:Uncharacterized protein n=1 Tax=Hibiscus sabdariffa TaxID=183260 RepID=A0ABR2RUM8_9ROSI